MRGVWWIRIYKRNASGIPRVSRNAAVATFDCCSLNIRVFCVTSLRSLWFQCGRGSISTARLRHPESRVRRSQAQFGVTLSIPSYPIVCTRIQSHPFVFPWFRCIQTSVSRHFPPLSILSQCDVSRIPCHFIQPHPIVSHAILSNLIPSYPMLSHPDHPIISHVISPCLIPSYPMLSHPASSHRISCYLTLPHPIVSHVISPCLIPWYLFASPSRHCLPSFPVVVHLNA